MKPWHPTHTDYFSCSAKVSKDAKTERRFHDFNERATQSHAAAMFIESLQSNILAQTPSVTAPRSVTFVVEACRLLSRYLYTGMLGLTGCFRCRAVIGFAYVNSFYSHDMEKCSASLMGSLENDVDALQAQLENHVVAESDQVTCVKCIDATDPKQPRQIQDLSDIVIINGYKLMTRIRGPKTSDSVDLYIDGSIETLEKVTISRRQEFKLFDAAIQR